MREKTKEGAPNPSSGAHVRDIDTPPTEIPYSEQRPKDRRGQAKKSREEVHKRDNQRREGGRATANVNGHYSGRTNRKNRREIGRKESLSRGDERSSREIKGGRPRVARWSKIGGGRAASTEGNAATEEEEGARERES